MISYHWTSAAIAVLIAATIILLVRHNQLHARNATWWILLALVIAVVGAFPGVVDWVALKLGISYPPILAVLLGMAVVLLKMLKMDIERSREQRRARILAQKVAILEAQLADQESEKDVRSGR